MASDFFSFILFSSFFLVRTVRLKACDGDSHIIIINDNYCCCCKQQHTSSHYMGIVLVQEVENSTLVV